MSDDTNREYPVNRTPDNEPIYATATEAAMLTDPAPLRLPRNIADARLHLLQCAYDLMALHGPQPAVDDAVRVLQEAAAALVGLYPTPDDAAAMRRAVMNDPLLYAAYNLGRFEARGA